MPLRVQESIFDAADAVNQHQQNDAARHMRRSLRAIHWASGSTVDFIVSQEDILMRGQWQFNHTFSSYYDSGNPQDGL